MSGTIALHAFMMLVYCAPGMPTCRVVYGHGIYPTMESCADAAPNWVWGINSIDKRHVAGALCELGRRPPAPYTIDACQLPGTYCGQLEQHRETRHQAQANRLEDP